MRHWGIGIRHNGEYMGAGVWQNDHPSTNTPQSTALGLQHESELVCMEEVNKHSRDRFSIRHRCENQTIDSMSIAVQQYPFCQFTHLTLLTSSMCCLRRSHYAIKKRYNQRTIMKKGACSFEPRGRYITLSSIKLQISVSTLCIPSHTLSTKHQGQISAHIHSSPPSPINLKSLLRNLNLLFQHSHLPTPIL